MVVLVVAAIILAFAVPSFQGIINSNRVTTAVNDLSTSFSVARTEAIKTNTTARVRPTTGTDWSQGYDIRVDANNDDTYADSERVRIVDAMDNTITFVDSTSTVFFNSLGGLGETFYSSSTSGTFTLSAPKAFTRVLVLSASGAATVCVGSAVNTTPSCP
jgi:type IV fimbrial biogenesis protein FimT